MEDNREGAGGIAREALAAGESLTAALAAQGNTQRSLEASLGDEAALDLCTTGSALETVTAMRRGRPSSPRSYSALGSLVAKGNGSSRCGSTPGTARSLAGGGVTTKAVQDSALLTAVRRQMEALEDKLSGQIGRVQQQSDRLRDAALARVDSKLITMEALQPKLDRRLAELSGNYKGLSDEMQAQIRRLDQMDSRLWEWRHQLEEEVRSKFVDVEQNQQRVSSSVRVMTATNEDMLKRQNQRVQRIESILEERLQVHEETHNGLMCLQDRLDQLEHTRLQELTLAGVSPVPTTPMDARDMALDSASTAVVETRLSDTCLKMDTLVEELRDAHTRLEAQEERLKSLHTRVESREEHSRWLNDRVERTDWEGRFKEIQEKMQQIDQGRIKHSEDIELMAKKLESSDQVAQECAEHVRRLNSDGRMFAEASTPVELSADLRECLQGTSVTEAISFEVKECTSRTETLETKLDMLSSELQSMRADVALAPRVAALVEQLKDVAPKVIEQELCVRELLEKVGRLEVEDRMKTTLEQGKSDSSTARIVRLEGAVDRLGVSMESLAHGAS